MTLAELRAELRAMIDDDGTGPKLWSDSLIDSKINAAQREACVRANLIREEFTISVVVGTILYEIEPNFYEIRRVLSASGDPLARTSVITLDKQLPGWQARSGTPRFYCHDQADPAAPAIILSAKPSAAQTMTVDAYRYPQPIAQGAEVDEERQLEMLHWAAHLCLMRRDQDQHAPKLAQHHADMFETYFGPPRSLKHMRTQNEGTLQQVTPIDF